MKPVRGFYYDGKSSVRHQVIFELEGDHLRIRGEAVNLLLPLDSINMAPRVAGVRRSFRFSNGALGELADDAPPDFMSGVKGEDKLHRFIDRWERSIPLATLALVLTLVVVVCFIRYGMPAIASHVASMVPPESEIALGKESLTFLDKYIMKPTKLPEEKQRETKELFAEIKGRLPQAAGYRMELRNAKNIGANAFALPGGTIVVTDAMVELAKSKDELAGVLAHEAAHQRSRHALRQVLQSTGTGLLIAALTGDITSITSLAATLPTLLIDAGYSREFEYEADDAAVDYMKKAGIKPKVYADILARLQAEHDKRSGEKDGGGRRWSPMELLSTHPETSERIKRVLGNS
jgi:Zn-dependent protease with chaperone function